MRANELRQAIAAELKRRGHGTRLLVVLNLPRPDGEPPPNDDRNASYRVVFAQDLPEGDPDRLRWDEMVKDLEDSQRKR